MELKQIEKIPIRFNAYDPTQEGGDSTPELGNYEWYLYQYRIAEDFDISPILKNEKVRSELGLFTKFHRSRIITFSEFMDFLVSNYNGWAPYGKGMPKEKALRLSENLVHNFLSCQACQAAYFIYLDDLRDEGNFYALPRRHETSAPYLISGTVGIVDPINKEFFFLIMGGTD